MLKKIFIGVAAFIGIFLIVAALQPNDFRVTRSITIAAEPAAIFPHINNPKLFHEWNPWAKIDPKAKETYEGPSEGVGSKMSWEGNNEVGKGGMTNIESRPNEFVKFDMEFIAPMAGRSIAEFTLYQKGSETVVTWSMYGPKNFIAKAFGLFMSCDDMIGGQFEKGLANLKAITESK